MSQVPQPLLSSQLGNLTRGIGTALLDLKSSQYDDIGSMGRHIIMFGD